MLIDALLDDTNNQEEDTLSFPAGELTEANCNTIVTVLTSSPHIHTLALNDTQLDDAKLLILVTGLMQEKILGLSLQTNGITDAGAKTLIFLKTLEEIDLRGNNISAEGFKDLVTNLPKLKKVSMDSKDISNTDLDAVLTSKSLVDLDIGRKLPQAVSDHLAENKSRQASAAALAAASFLGSKSRPAATTLPLSPETTAPKKRSSGSSTDT